MNATDEALGLEELISVAVLTVKPGDVVVFRCSQELSKDQLKHLREAWKEVTDRAGILCRPAIVLGSGTDIAVLRFDKEND